MTAREIKNRTFKDLEDAVAKLPCNIQAMAEFILDKSHPESERIDFMYTLCGQRHPSIKYILNCVASRDDGMLSNEAYKILKRYDSSPEYKSYNNFDEALSELPDVLKGAARRFISKDINKYEFRSMAELLISSRLPAAAYILEKTRAVDEISRFLKI